jgi:hypothetical protein
VPLSLRYQAGTQNVQHLVTVVSQCLAK